MGRAIIGGAIGATVGAAIWLGVENSMSRDLPWLALLVGLLAGLGVRFCCGQDQRSFMTGTIAAVVALLGVVLGPMANQLWLQYNFDRRAKPIVNEEALLDGTESIDADYEPQDETVAEEESVEGANQAADGKEDDEEEAAESAGSPDENQSSTKSMIAVARPLLAQVTGDDEDEGSSAVREFFDKNRDLIIYAASAILAYILGSGGSTKLTAPEPAADAGGATE